MSRIVQTTVYQYDELSPEAQERARQWYREASAGDGYYSESVVEEAVQWLALMGIEVKTRECRSSKGRVWQEPCIFWSGFWSQGDGAQFEGTWRARDCTIDKLLAEYPTESKLHAIGEVFARVAKLDPEARFTVKSSGRYSHECCTDFEVELPGFDELIEQSATNGPRYKELCERYLELEKELITAARDAMRHIYRELEAAYDFSVSDEAVTDAIESNQYEFTEQGEIA